MHETKLAEPTLSSAPSPTPLSKMPVPVPKIAQQAGRKKSARAEVELDDETPSEEVQSILNQITVYGNALTHEVKKVAEIRTQSGQVVYLVKTQSKMNRIVLAVHPEHKPERLSVLPGVESVSSDHRFHSNMVRFPKKKNKGEKETQYGWHVITNSPSACQRFLASL